MDAYACSIHIDEDYEKVGGDDVDDQEQEHFEPEETYIIPDEIPKEAHSISNGKEIENTYSITNGYN